MLVWNDSYADSVFPIMSYNFSSICVHPTCWKKGVKAAHLLHVGFWLHSSNSVICHMLKTKHLFFVLRICATYFFNMNLMSQKNLSNVFLSQVCYCWLFKFSTMERERNYKSLLCLLPWKLKNKVDTLRQNYLKIYQTSNICGGQLVYFFILLK